MEKTTPTHAPVSEPGERNTSAASTVAGFQTRLELIGRTAGVLGIIAYVIGLVTINAYLLGFGISDFSLLRARFVYAGTLVLLSLAITWVFFAFARDTVVASLRRPERPPATPVTGRAEEEVGHTPTSQVRAEGDTRRVFPWFRAVLVIAWGLILAAFTPFAIFVMALNSGDAWNDSRNAFLLWVTGLFTAAVLSAAWSEEDRSVNRLAAHPEVVVFLAGYLVVFLLVFARFIYPAVPEQFGGGRPRPAKLMVNPAAIAGLTEIGFSFVPDRPLSGCVEVLFVGDDTYVVSLPGGKVAQVDKSIVSALLIDAASGGCPSASSR